MNSASRRIVGMYSKEGEFINFPNHVDTSCSPEMWLSNLESEMKNAVKSQVYFTYEAMDSDMPKVPLEKADFNKWLSKDINTARTIDEVSLLHWVSSWPGQATYLSC